MNHGQQPGSTANLTFVDTPKKSETQSLSRPHAVPGTWGAEIEDGVKSRLNNLEGYRTTVNYIKKAQDHRVDSYSAFADNQHHRFTTLDRELALHGIDTIVLTGLVTTACVRGTAIDAIKLGYEVILVEDATEASSEKNKKTAIEELEGWGVQVIKLKDWEKKNKVPAKRKGGREE